MRVLAIVVNYRTAERTLRAVESIVPALTPVEGRLTVVDNDSQDGSYELLSRAITERGLGGRVEVVQAPRNGGFGYGNNFAVRRTYDAGDPPQYFYMVNPDAVVDPDAIATLATFLDGSTKAGIAGSRIFGLDGKPHTSAFRFPTPLGELESGLKLGLASRLLGRWIVAPGHRKASGEVDWVSGASFMVKRDVFESIGLFDETFFLYFEEIDLCLRAKAAGFSTWYVHESRVEHEGGVATGVNDGTRRPVPEYWFASRRRFFAKNYGMATLASANLLFTLGYSLFRVRRRLQRKVDVDPPNFLSDFVRYNWVPGRLSGASEGRPVEP